MATYLKSFTSDFEKTCAPIYEDLEKEERDAAKAVVNDKTELEEYVLLYGASAINNAYKLRNSVLLADGNFSPKMREYKDDNAEQEIMEMLNNGQLKTEVFYDNLKEVEGYSQRNYHEVENTCYRIVEGKYKSVCFAKAYNTKENRNCIVVDISNTELTDLSKKWQLSNISAYEFASKLVAKYPNKDIDWYAAAVHYYWLNENQYAIEYNEPTAKPYCLLEYSEKIKDRDNVYVAETFEQNKDKLQNIEKCRDIVRVATKNVAKKIGIGNKNVNVFLSVAWPEKNNIADNQLIANIADYMKKQGITLINVKNFPGDRKSLVKQIKSSMINTSAVLTLAFGKHNTNKTSPFVYLESDIASNLKLTNLALVPQNVALNKQLENAKKLIIEKNEKGEYDIENSLSLKLSLDRFIDSAKLTAFGTLELKDYVDNSFKKVNEEEFKNRILEKYDVKKNILQEDIVFKKPVKVEANIITESGLYNTADGEMFLNVDDVLVKNAGEQFYKVSAEEFDKIYIKDNKSDFYIKKPIPMVVLKQDKNFVTVCPMYNPSDVYNVPVADFEMSYESLYTHLRNHSVQTQEAYNEIK